MRDLLTALLVASGNDAAITLAEGVAGSQQAFVARMNPRARELGLTRTRFANPHGLDAPGHHSSVRDLVTLARVAMRNPVFRETVASRRATIPGPGGAGHAATYVSENAPARHRPRRRRGEDRHDRRRRLRAGGPRAPAALGVAQLYAALIGSPSAAARARDGRAPARLRPLPVRPRRRLIPEGTVFGRVPVDGRPGRRSPYRAAAAAGRPAAPRRAGHRDRDGARPSSRPGRRGPGRRQRHAAPGRARARARDLVAAESAGEPELWDRVRAGVEALVP